MSRRRAGYALIELMVVITVIAVMLGLSAALIQLLLKLDRSGRSATEEAADMARLARDFRADAHASKPSEASGPSSDRMILPIEAGRTVEYQVRPLDIVRTVREGDKARRFETYRRPAKASVRMERSKEGPRPFATLIIDRPTDGKDNSLYRDYRIEAEVGKDLRQNPRPE